VKLWKQFLSADYAMELYERFHSLKQRGMFVEECTSVFNNLSARVGLNETNEQMTSCYLAGLNQSIRDELRVVHLFHLEDARQYALMAEKQVLCFGARRPLSGRDETTTQRGSTIVWSVRNDQSTQKIGQDTTIMNWRMGRSIANIDRSDKGVILVQPLPRLVLDHRCDV